MRIGNPFLNRLVGPAEDAWRDHPSFAGVHMARLVGADQSEGGFTTLAVCLEPGAKMLPHRHEGQVEQHVVLAGAGVLETGEGRRSYAPGTLAVIAKGQEHSVVANEDGMVILALFSPASS